MNCTFSFSACSVNTNPPCIVITNARSNRATTKSHSGFCTKRSALITWISAKLDAARAGCSVRTQLLVPRSHSFTQPSLDALRTCCWSAVKAT